MPLPILVQQKKVDWDQGTIKIVSEHVAETTIAINGKEYTITINDPKTKFTTNIAKERLSEQIDTMTLLGMRFLGDDTKTVIWNPSTQTVTKEYTDQRSHTVTKYSSKPSSQKKIPILSDPNSMDAFITNLKKSYDNHKTKLDSISEGAPPDVRPKAGKEHDFEFRVQKLNRIVQTLELFKAYRQGHPSSTPASAPAASGEVKIQSAPAAALTPPAAPPAPAAVLQPPPKPSPKIEPIDMTEVEKKRKFEEAEKQRRGIADRLESGQRRSNVFELMEEEEEEEEEEKPPSPPQKK